MSDLKTSNDFSTHHECADWAVQMIGMAAYKKTIGKFDEGVVIYEEALDLYRDAMDRFGRQASLLSGYGEALLKGYKLGGVSRDDEALQVFEESLEIEPNNIVLLNQLARWYRLRKDFEQSETYLFRAVLADLSKNKDQKLGLRDVFTLTALFDLYSDWDEVELAAGCAWRGNRIDPDDRMLTQRKNESFFKRGIDAQPSHWLAVFARIDAYNKEHNPDWPEAMPQ